MKTALVPDFYSLWPERFSNKTNGVAHRRWMLKANPELARLLGQAIGEGWVTDLDQARELEQHAEEPAFSGRISRDQAANKERLAGEVFQTTPIDVDPHPCSTSR